LGTARAARLAGGRPGDLTSGVDHVSNLLLMVTGPETVEGLVEGGVEVHLANVSKRYSTRAGDLLLAVDDVSLDIAASEFVSIVGPSGCGKSTLLLMVAGLIPRSGGTIEIGATDVDRPYTDLGFVFQDAVLLDWRKVRANIMLQADIRKRDRALLESRADRLLELVGLQGFEDRYPYELSGGMRQRVSICRSLVHDPPLLLMDEPFGALDAITRDQLNVDLEALWLQSPKTVVFVTHSIAEAVFLADRVVVMSPRPGRIVEIVEVDLLRPRPLSMRETPEFIAYTRRIRQIFERAGVLQSDFGVAAGR
jgi:NitT/TauT family transport system ATP-binding protein